MNTQDRAFLHGLIEKHYLTRVQQREREKCISCGKPRVLGQRGAAKGKCKKCRRIGVSHGCCTPCSEAILNSILDHTQENGLNNGNS